MDLVVIAQYPSTPEATMAKNCLVNEGIDAVLTDENTGDLFHLAADFGEVKLLVPADQVERAKDVLQKVHDHTRPHGYHKPE
jgi:hypothetical protein